MYNDALSKENKMTLATEFNFARSLKEGNMIKLDDIISMDSYGTLSAEGQIILSVYSSSQGDEFVCFSSLEGADRMAVFKVDSSYGSDGLTRLMETLMNFYIEAGFLREDTEFIFEEKTAVLELAL